MIVIIISSLFDDVTDLGSIYYLKLSLFFVSISAMSTLNEILIETSKERTTVRVINSNGLGNYLIWTLKFSSTQSIYSP